MERERIALGRGKKKERKKEIGKVAWLKKERKKEEKENS